LHSNGVEKLADASKFEGNYKEGKKHRCETSYMRSDRSKFVGDCFDNKINGLVLYIWLDGTPYEGSWKYNNIIGQGTYTWSDGRKYEVEYFMDKKK
jgi:hypothetical protein